jgi:chromosome segregation ATPase
MTSQPASTDDHGTVCKRPGCGRPLPAQDRGRSRQFCSTDCARRFHNHSRIPVPAGASVTGEDPLATLDTLIRQAAVLTRAARDQAASLDPASVRTQIADAEAARRRAEAAVVTAQAQAAEALQETAALTEALTAARDDLSAAQAAAQHADGTARTAADELEQLRRDSAAQITGIQAQADQQVTAARTDADRHARERDDAITAARDARHAADAEISRARQAETDARAETERVRADAARERDTLREHHQAELAAARALTDAERARAERAETQLDTERADRRTLMGISEPPVLGVTPGAGDLSPVAAGGLALRNTPDLES